MQSYIAQLKNTIKNSKLYLIISAIFFLTGIVLSFFSHKFEGLMFYINVLERYTFIFDTTMHVSSYFLSKVIASLGISIVFFLSGITIYTIPIHFIIFLYQGFVIGAVCPYFFSAFYISGIVVYVVALLPSMILRFSINSLFSLISVKISRHCKEYNLNKYSALLLMFFIVFMTHIIAILWECLFIGIIIKPFNTFF